MGSSSSKVNNRSLYFHENTYNVVSETLTRTDIKVESKVNASNKTVTGNVNFSGNKGTNASVKITAEMRNKVKQLVEMKTVIDAVMKSSLNNDEKLDALMGMLTGLESNGTRLIGKDSNEANSDMETHIKNNFNLEMAQKILTTYNFILHTLASNEAVMGNIDITNNEDSNFKFEKADVMLNEIENSAVSNLITEQLSEQGIDNKTIEKIQEKAQTESKKTSNLDEVSGDVADTVKNISEDISGTIKSGFDMLKVGKIVLAVVVVVIIIAIAGVAIVKAMNKSKTQQQMLAVNPEMYAQFYSPQVKAEARQQRLNQYGEFIGNTVNSVKQIRPIQQQQSYVPQPVRPVQTPQSYAQQQQTYEDVYEDEYEETYGLDELYEPENYYDKHTRPVPYYQGGVKYLDSQVYFTGGKTEYDTVGDLLAVVEPVKIDSQNRIVTFSNRVLTDLNRYATSLPGQTKKIKVNLVDKYGNEVYYEVGTNEFKNIDDIIINTKAEEIKPETLTGGVSINPKLIGNIVKNGKKVVKKGFNWGMKHKDQIKKYGKKGYEFAKEHKKEIKKIGKAAAKGLNKMMDSYEPSYEPKQTKYVEEDVESDDLRSLEQVPIRRQQVEN